MMKLFVSLCILLFPFLSLGADGNDNYGCVGNPTGNPIGGAVGYNRHVQVVDFRVDNKQQLLDALRQARSGNVIYIDDCASIDLTGEVNLRIHSGVTLASGRGTVNMSYGESSRGALIFTNQLDTESLLTTCGEKVRITGLRIKGPDPERRTEQMKKLLDAGGHSKTDGYYSIPNSVGITAFHPSLEIDNCEIWGWSHAAIRLKTGAVDAYIHHSYIHHNQRSGLGYGICHDGGSSVIEANVFDWNRHSIAGTGSFGTRYEARYNLVLENHSSHQFDMHGSPGDREGIKAAGDWISIHHNTFHLPQPFEMAIANRGIPRIMAEIHHNRFEHTKIWGRSVYQQNGQGNLYIYENLVGPDQMKGEELRY